MSVVYRDQRDRPAIDCPICGQEVVCHRNGAGYRFDCRGGHTDDEVVAELHPVVMLELGRAESGAAPASDSNAVEIVRRALLDDPADLAAAMRGDRPARDMVPGSNGLVARGVAHTFFGVRGSGKSLVMGITACSMAEAGERVLILDRENGPDVNGDRFGLILDAHPDWEHVLDDGLLVGKHYPTLKADWDGDSVAEALDGFTVVLLDSTREFIGQLGGGNNDDDAVTLLWNTIVTPLLRRNVAVVLADNTGHEHLGRPKGAGGKMDAAPQIYRVEQLTEFGPTKTGEVQLTCTRSRFGDVDRVWMARLGDGVYDLPVSETEAPDEERYRVARARRDAFRAVAERVLPDDPERMSGNALIDALKDRGAGVRRQKALAWLNDLADDALVPAVARDDKGFYRAKRPRVRGGGSDRALRGVARSGTTPRGTDEEEKK